MHAPFDSCLVSSTSRQGMLQRLNLPSMLSQRIVRSPRANAVGAAIWNRLPPDSSSLQELCGSLNSLYPEVDIPVLMADVTELLEALLAEGLVVPATADAA